MCVKKAYQVFTLDISSLFLLCLRNGFQGSTRLSLLMPVANFQYKERKIIFQPYFIVMVVVMGLVTKELVGNFLFC